MTVVIAILVGGAIVLVLAGSGNSLFALAVNLYNSGIHRLSTWLTYFDKISLSSYDSHAKAHNSPYCGIQSMPIANLFRFGCVLLHGLPRGRNQGIFMKLDYLSSKPDSIIRDSTTYLLDGLGSFNPLFFLGSTAFLLLCAM
jgi:hypothetical protein